MSFVMESDYGTFTATGLGVANGNPYIYLMSYAYYNVKVDGLI
jgi:hypothetical protein